jgi:hypothetical protein
MSYPLLAPEEDSYGTVEGVAAYVGVYTDDGQFNSTTTPTHERVVIWIDQVSDMFNTALSSAGFRTPIEHTDARSAIAATVEQIVSDLVHASNSKGRFFSSGFQDRGVSILSEVWKEIEGWVSSHAVGFTNWQVGRVSGTLGKIGSKGFDESGEEMYPIFQRKGFGNFFRDWTQRNNG